VPKNIPESLTLRIFYPAFSDEGQEDIGPFGYLPPIKAPPRLASFEKLPLCLVGIEARASIFRQPCAARSRRSHLNLSELPFGSGDRERLVLAAGAAEADQQQL
jgi:hypothetical protein